MRDVALVAAVFSTAVPIYRGDLPAAMAGDLVVGFTLYLVEMLIPPLIATFIAAEFPLFAFRLLDNLCSAILTRSTG